MGLENPNVRMLPAISATCASLCVRALRGEGSKRSVAQNSSRSLAAAPAPLDEGLGLVASLATGYPPTLNFAANSRSGARDRLKKCFRQFPSDFSAAARRSRSQGPRVLTAPALE